MSRPGDRPSSRSRQNLANAYASQHPAPPAPSASTSSSQPSDFLQLGAQFLQSKLDKAARKNEELKRRGVKPVKTPLWQRLGESLVEELGDMQKKTEQGTQGQRVGHETGQQQHRLGQQGLPRRMPSSQSLPQRYPTSSSNRQVPRPHPPPPAHAPSSFSARPPVPSQPPLPARRHINSTRTQHAPAVASRTTHRVEHSLSEMEPPPPYSEYDPYADRTVR